MNTTWMVNEYMYIWAHENHC